MSVESELQTEVFPLLPLREVSIQPEQEMRLFVGRIPSQRALGAAQVSNSCVFAVTQREPNKEIPDIGSLYSIGTVAQVQSVLKLPDGNLKVEVVGLWRARVVEISAADGYLTVRVERVSDDEDHLLEMGPPPVPPPEPKERPDDVIESIAIPGFDEIGDVYIDVERCGSLWLLFNQMPPTWVPEVEYAHFGRCGNFDKELEMAISASVIWDDRERFYIEHPTDDCVERIRAFLADFRARNEPKE